MVGTWNSTSPDGNQSVGDNRVPMQENTTYIEDNMQLDHYWAEDVNNDGHHRYVQSPKVESGGSPTDPTLDTGMDGVAYFKEKTAAESTTHQPTLPFFKDSAATPAVLEMMGMRACGVFTSIGGTLVERYLHNCSITRNSAGNYSVSFTTDLPSTYYGVLAGGHGGLVTTLDLRSILANSVSGCVLNTTLNGTVSATDINTGWFVCFGG